MRRGLAKAVSHRHQSTPAPRPPNCDAGRAPLALTAQQPHLHGVEVLVIERHGCDPKTCPDAPCPGRHFLPAAFTSLSTSSNAVFILGMMDWNIDWDNAIDFCMTIGIFSITAFPAGVA